ncbi:MAG: phage virion morphogenesis protein [Gammaproteobacteria bacterium]
MAGGQLRLSVQVEVQPVVDALNRLVAAGARLRPAFKEIGDYLLQSTEARFRAQRSPDGVPWAPLSPAYAARKAKAGKGSTLLVLNGYLRDQMRYQADDDELRFGTDRVYGATHQFGRPEARIPARPVLGLDAADETEIVAILNDHLAAALPG